MRIRVNPFDKRSVENAIKQLEQYERDFEVKKAEFARRLAEIGVRVASAGFSTADYDGDNDVVVSLIQTQNGATVVASGETVGFIEFGTGVKNPEWDNAGMEYTPPKHGTYGKGKGKNPNGWYFTQSPGARATHTYGNHPAEAMRTARDEMVEQAIRIAREVWR